MTEAFRVLVVEDDADVAAYTKAVLEKRGACEVRVTGDPFAAQAMVVEFVPDVVVTDIEMPGMTGLELMDQIRSVQQHMPVVVMTAHISVDYAVAALRAQADEFLTKPIGADDLVTVVRRLAADGRANRESARVREHVLAIGAHPGDVELAIGGVLSFHRSVGDSVTILTLSRAATGAASDGLQHESLVAAELIGARLFLEDLSAAQLSNTAAAVAVIERVVAEINPTVIYTHSAHDSDQDHRTVHEASLVATKAIATVGCYQSPSSTVDYSPSRFAAIDNFTDSKVALVQCFASQPELQEYRDPEKILAAARHWGKFGNSVSAEPIEVVRENGSR